MTVMGCRCLICQFRHSGPCPLGHRGILGSLVLSRRHHHHTSGFPAFIWAPVPLKVSAWSTDFHVDVDHQRNKLHSVPQHAEHREDQHRLIHNSFKNVKKILRRYCWEHFPCFFVNNLLTCLFIMKVDHILPEISSLAIFNTRERNVHDSWGVFG